MRAALLAALCIGLALACAPAASARRRAPARPALKPVSVSFAASEPGASVPQEFLGLSFEDSSLRQVAAYAGGGNMLTFLRSLGPGVLRFGGVSADTRTGWTDAQTPLPSWASSAIDPEDLGELGRLASESGWKVLLTVGLGHYEPLAAAREVASAQAQLGSSLEGVELGNEPNSYALHGLRGEPWTFVQYDEQVAAYRSAIEALAPGVPLAGPDSSGSSAYESWGLGEAIDQRPALLTGHHYPLGCEQHPSPSIERLLSPVTRARELGSLRRYVAIAREGQIPFRLDETNSVSCGGTPGISDTFASALWATGYLAQAMSAGVSGINFHGNLSFCQGYTPLCAQTPEALALGALQAQPEWYALLLARSLVGSRPLPTTTSTGRQANVEVESFLAPDGTLRFVVVDYDPPGSRTAAVRLPVGGAYAGASILKLTGPSPQALTGVRLGGVSVGANGIWTSPPRLPALLSRHGAIVYDAAPSTAALLTVSPRSSL